VIELPVIDEVDVREESGRVFKRLLRTAGHGAHEICTPALA
jgi:hypothetical protein